MNLGCLIIWYFTGEVTEIILSSCT